MQPLPYQDHRDSEATPVSEILARANPAEMPAMRASLSFLTSAGAELATAGLLPAPPLPQQPPPHPPRE